MSEQETTYNPSLDELLDGYHPASAAQRYEARKEVMQVRTSNPQRLGPKGTLSTQPLKKLSARHQRMIALHVEGKKVKEIAAAVGVTYSTAWRVLNDPLSKQLIAEIHDSWKLDIEALTPKAIEAISVALDNPDSLRALQGVDRFLRLKEINKTPEVSGTQVNVTIVNDAREKLVSAIRERMPAARTIDGEAKELEDA